MSMATVTACWSAGSQFGFFHRLRKNIPCNFPKVTLILCNQCRCPIWPAGVQRSARLLSARPPCWWGGSNVVDGMPMEARDACVAGAVCDQTDDQLQDQVPGPRGSLTRYSGSCLLTESIVQIGRKVSFNTLATEFTQRGRRGCLFLADERELFGSTRAQPKQKWYK